MIVVSISRKTTTVVFLDMVLILVLVVLVVVSTFPTKPRGVIHFHWGRPYLCLVLITLSKSTAAALGIHSD
jgi:hypothetical protein